MKPEQVAQFDGGGGKADIIAAEARKPHIFAEPQPGLLGCWERLTAAAAWEDCLRLRLRLFRNLGCLLSMLQVDA